MLVIAPQFLAPADLRKPKKSWNDMEDNESLQRTHSGFKVQKLTDKVNPDDFLRWRYNDWRGAEPALNEGAPIDSFTAMDSLIESILKLTPNAQTIEFRGNSEGGQFMNRYLAYSKALNRIELDRTDNENKIKIRGIFSNPGTVHYFTPLRPVFDKNGKIVRWKEYAFESPENMWPFGLYDPPPYISESLNEWPHRDPKAYPNKNAYEDTLLFAVRNFLRRSILAIGRNDDVVGGFHLPKGPGPAYAAQGNTRYQRMKGLFYFLHDIVRKNNIENTFPPRMLIIENVEHNAREVFLITEPYSDIIREAESLEMPL